MGRILLRTAREADLRMDDSLDEIFFFRCGHCQRQQWGYYVTARWLAYRKHYLVRDTIVPRVQSKDSPPLHK